MTQTATKSDLKTLINSCDFIDDKSRKDFVERAQKMPDNSVQIVYKKFKDAKNKIDNIYIEIALSNDTNGNLISQALQTIQSIK